MIKDIAKILIALFDIMLGIVPLVFGFFWETISNYFCSGRCYSRELSRWMKSKPDEAKEAWIQEDKDYARQCADEKWRSQYR